MSDRERSSTKQILSCAVRKPGGAIHPVPGPGLATGRLFMYMFCTWRFQRDSAVYGRIHDWNWQVAKRHTGEGEVLTFECRPLANLIEDLRQQI